MSTLCLSHPLTSSSSADAHFAGCVLGRLPHNSKNTRVSRAKMHRPKIHSSTHMDAFTHSPGRAPKSGRTAVPLAAQHSISSTSAPKTDRTRHTGPQKTSLMCRNQSRTRLLPCAAAITPTKAWYQRTSSFEEQFVHATPAVRPGTAAVARAQYVSMSLRRCSLILFELRLTPSVRSRSACSRMTASAYLQAVCLLKMLAVPYAACGSHTQHAHCNTVLAHDLNLHARCGAPDQGSEQQAINLRLSNHVAQQQDKFRLHTLCAYTFANKAQLKAIV